MLSAAVALVLSSQEPPSSIKDRIWSAGFAPCYRLEPLFTIDAELWVSFRRSSLSELRRTEPYCLVAASPDDVREIRRLSDLTGKVKIASEWQALQFCRLLTSPVAAGALNHEDGGRRYFFEVTTPRLLGLDGFFGRNDAYRRNREYVEKGSLGALDEGMFPDEVFKLVGAPRASAKLRPADFVIERTLLRYDLSDASAKAVVFDVEETVTRDGRYRRKSRKSNLTLTLKRPGLPQLEW